MSLPLDATCAGADDASDVIAMICGSWTSRAIAVATGLRLADRIAAGLADPASLARHTGSDADALARLMRALCSLGLLREAGDGQFALTGRGTLLRFDAPGGASLAHFVTWWDRYLGPVWDKLEASVESGLSARRIALGHERFERVDDDPATAAAFDRAMGEITRFVGVALAALVGTDPMTIMDVGGGNGALLIPLLDARPSAKGILYELPGAAAAAQSTIDARGIGGRCATVAGDFFERVPEGGDLYLLKSVLHDWNDERCARILSNIRKALGPRGRLIVIERVMADRIDETAKCRETARNDLNMLVAVGGRERTGPAYRSLLAAASLEIVDSRPLPLHYTALIATPR